MTNFEKIKSMNDVEMAGCIHEAVRCYCADNEGCYRCRADKYFGGCSIFDIKLWLKREVEEE